VTTQTMRPLGIAGAWEIAPALHGEPGRLFAELCRFDELADLVGRPTRPAQASLAVSTRGSVRGIHYAHGQVTYFACISGTVLDIVVDIRVGSPTFGQWEMVRLDDVDRHATYLQAGLGHGYYVCSEQATLLYLVSRVYVPEAEREIHPLDPALGIAWPVDGLVLSGRDAAAPTLDAALAAGMLPHFDQAVSQ